MTIIQFQMTRKEAEALISELKDLIEYSLKSTPSSTLLLTLLTQALEKKPG